MFKISALLTVLFLTACNSNSSESSSTSDSSKNANSSATTVSTWSKEDENEFLDGCIENAKVRLGLDTAYIYCNCVLKQIEQEFPTMDSASTALLDTTRAAAFTEKCN